MTFIFKILLKTEIHISFSEERFRNSSKMNPEWFENLTEDFEGFYDGFLQDPAPEFALYAKSPYATPYAGGAKDPSSALCVHYNLTGEWCSLHHNQFIEAAWCFLIEFTGLESKVIFT